MKVKLSAEGRLRLAVRSAFLVGLAAGAHGTAYAQDAAPKAPTAPQAANPGDATRLEAVTVTGTRIPSENLTSTSSMTIINDEEMKLQGTVNVETLINNLPMTFAEFSSNDSNGASGTATVDLRGLGPSRTLVLIDGKRLMPGDPLQTPPSADLNFIPANLVDSIEVLSGGASAIYGSDAVSGVVNFKMKRNFEGLQLGSQFSQTSHHDGLTRDYSLIWGANTANGNGNVTLYAGYTRQNAITQDKRDFSACSITTPASGTTHKCAGSRTIAEGLIYSYDRAGSPNQAISSTYYGIVNTDGTRTFLPDDGRTFNFAPFNFFQRPSQRYNLGGFAHIEINSHFDVYGSAMFMDNRSVAAVAPSGLFFLNAAIPCNSPLLGPQQVQFLCTDVGLGPTDFANTLVAKRAVEVGPRLNDLQHTDYRFNIGLKGTIVDGITYDTSLQRGEVIYAGGQLNYINSVNAKDGLNTAVDAQGNAVCASGNPGCVPLDLFRAGGIDQNQINFIRAVGYEQANLIEEIATASVAADLGRFGVKIPTAHDGIGVAVGVEHRRESSDYRPDDNVRTANLGGFGGPRPAVAGSFGVQEFFTEVRLPIIQDMPGVKLLQADAAYRTAEYSLAGRANSYKGGLEYAPTGDAIIRTSYARATRAPAITELFSPQAIGLFTGKDPCAGVNLRLANPPTAAQCANTGVTQAQYDAGINNTGGQIAECSAGQCNGLFGGNPALKPEDATTKSIGIVITPRIVKNLAITIDYFNILVDKPITVLAPGVILTQCVQTGNPVFCTDVHRPASGRLSGDATNANVGFISSVNKNLGNFKTTGFDFAAAYAINIAAAGRLSFNYQSTYLKSLSTDIGPGLGGFDCAGLFGPTCVVPSPTYRHQFRTTLAMPFGLTGSINWRYYGSVKLDQNDPNPNLNDGGGVNVIDGVLKSKSYLDLAGEYALPIKQSVKLNFGINNVTDTKPQQVSSNAPNPVSGPPFGNGNTFPNTYDPLGPTFFVGVTANF